MPLVVVTTSPRVAPGVLSHQAWQALSSGRVLTGSADHPQLPYLAEAGIEVEVVTPDHAALVRQAVDDTVVWLAGEDEGFMRAVGHAALALDDPPVIEVVPGSYDLPGARVLDLVAVMDRLRTECPWDRKQTHASLVPYLIEEAYEVQHAVEQGYGLREELGDVLLQVAFHARVADDFDIDDVADVIVGKLIRRHPHVFGDVSAETADEVNTNWEAIKAHERAGKELFDGVPMGQPALSLAAQLIRRAESAGAPEGLAHAVGQGVARELFDLVRRAQEAGLDPEAELRGAAMAYRARVEAWESR
ncbi:nucleoside triphosphate pyrophosphohydrolase [Nonomuraea africana]|uniref:XTP/dITP diphosphohydrolase n=1 Tax=Nonomuraea africana TaxID=46171 RepID=A0ABR9KN85_9ACTN|nr:MazG family protein [Nonomuraea africana]MBE1563491.1 XTP/dITP diphosphohydrolase [Nonomuraea africana]